MSVKNGKVYLVGAGPGDPDLLTLKAFSLLKSADVVLYDALINPAVLDLVNKQAEMIYAGKRFDDGQDQTERQEEINMRLIDYAREGSLCVRLKAGDPFIFGRGVEEVRALVEEGIAVEVVPGVTAGIAAAGLAHIPLTERNRMTSVLFCTGHTVHDAPEQFSALVSLLKAGSSIVMYMGLKNLEGMVDRLLGKGLPSGLPVSVVSRVSYPDQVTLSGSLQTIVFMVNEKGISTPAIFLIGEHAVPACNEELLEAVVRNNQSS